MAGLIILLILIPLAFFILLISILNQSSAQKRLLESMNDRLSRLNQQLEELTKSKQDIPVKPSFQERIEKQLQAAEDIRKEAKPREEESIPVATVDEEQPVPIEELIITSPEKMDPPPATPGWWSRWLQNNPDLEKFIGENLANKIGIAVLVLGIFFFVKYAIDKNWIQEAGRVIIGLISGGILIGFGHYFRNRYRSFSSVLAGGGVAVFFLTTAFAFHQYNLISQQGAFIIMVVITLFAVLLSMFYDRLELAVLATLGGFLTPFLVSTGQENYIVLFIYLCILNTGLIALAWFKRWPVLTTIGLFFTMIIYGGWLTKRLWNDENGFPYEDALLFATAFYVLFISMSIINNVRLKRSFTAFDFITVLTVNLLYYAAGMLILDYWNDGKYQGLFTAALAIVNFILALAFYRSKKIDRNFIFLLTGLCLIFITLIAPVQLKGNHITLFWAAEAVLVFALYQRTRIVVMKNIALILVGLMIENLLSDWSAVYYTSADTIPLFSNKGFITGLVAAVSLFVYYYLLHKEADTYYYKKLTNRVVSNILLVASILCFYLTGALEINYQFSTRFPDTGLNIIYLQLYSYSLTLLLLYIFRRSVHYPLLRFGLTVLCLGLYLFNIYNNSDIVHEMLSTGKHQAHFLAHWAAAAILFKLLYDLILFFRKNREAWSSYQTSFTWMTASCIVFLLSVEMYYAILWMNFENQQDWIYWENLYYKSGLTILWGICSFVMMWLGMKNHFRTLRIISLTLFTITLCKLFLYDITNIPPGGKIAAFIMLGLLLLIVSFMYQRLKKIIIDDASGST